MKEKATIYDLHRMCSSREDCAGCPIEDVSADCGTFLGVTKDDMPKINQAILKWCKENPVKTYKEDFLEKFPNAKLEEVTDDKVPTVCRNKVYKNCSCHKTKDKSPLEHTLIFTGDCIECWNESMEEEE